MKFLKEVMPLIFVIALSFWAVKPLFIPGFFPIHDDTQVARVFEMTKSFSDGMIPVRWVSDLGYGFGYPIFNFYAPLPYYIGGSFQILGFDALFSTKLMMILGIAMSGVFMYLLAKQFWGEVGAVISAMFYVYAPYHALDIYVRGDVSEFWAYAFVPLTFLGLYKVFKSDEKFKWTIVGALGFGGIILSHNLTAMMVTPFIIIALLLYCYIVLKKKKLLMLRYPISAILLGLMIASFYWLPALSEHGYTNVLSQIGGGADFRSHFVCAYQLWQSQWGFGGSAPGCIDGLSFMVGKLHLIISVLVLLSAIVLIVLKKFKDKEKLLVLSLSFLGLFLSAVFTLEISKPIWEAVTPMEFFQYPWRFLLMASFFTSFICGSTIWLLNILKVKNLKVVLYISSTILVFLLLLFNVKFFIPQTIVNKNVNDYTNETTLRWDTSRISDEYMPKNFPKPGIENDTASQRFLFDGRSLLINRKIEKTQNIELWVLANTATKIHFNIAYFPAWIAFIDGRQVKYKYDRGYNLDISKGPHLVEMKFIQTPIERISNLFSFAGILILSIGIIGVRKKSYG